MIESIAGIPTHLQWLTDSRDLSLPEQTLFFAIRGKQHDGHQFIPQLVEAGVRHFVVERGFEATTAGCFFYAVPDVIATLQALASHHRSQFRLPVIAITGSNGKTIIKEWLFETLKENFIIAKSPKSFNSQIGVPLSVRILNARHELGIFEAGISERGEMARLAPIIAPSIGVFTNLGSAHDEGFESRAEKAREKALLFRDCPLVIYPAAYPEITAALPNATGAWHWICPPKNGGIQIRYQSENLLFNVPFDDFPSMENAATVAVVLHTLGLSQEHIQQRLQQLSGVPMRLSIKRGIQQGILVDDTYNNDLAGLAVALDFLQTHAPHADKVAILSDIPQTGLSPETRYAQVKALCNQKNISTIIYVGKSSFPSETESLFFEDTQSLLTYLDTPPAMALLQRKAVLVKGARAFGFERVVQRLEEKIHGTRLEINLTALRHNLNVYRRWLPAHTRLLVMVKAFAYGSGNREVARLLEHQHVDYLGVAYVDEGVTLRQEGIRLPILVLNPTPESFPLLLRYDLEPELYSLRLCKAWIRFLNTQQITIPPSAHLKLDTGMRRLGLTSDDLPELERLLREYPFPVASIFTHLSAADMPEEDDFTRQQVAHFQENYQKIAAWLPSPPLRHILNSAGIERFPEYAFEMVRLGIGLYGIATSTRLPEALLPISTLKTTISQIKTLSAHQSIGYGRAGRASATGMRTATVAIGYADGYPRHFSRGVGRMYVRGKAAPVVGNVCMDMCMLDITDIPEAREGDEVTVFGSWVEAAAAIGTIPYELLTNIGARVRRVFFED